MYQPNYECIGFCNWLLNLSKQKLSGPQRALVQSVQSAAIAGTPVSDQTWWNFNLFAPWRNKYYLVFKEYAVFTVPTLLTDVLISMNFEGNANNLVTSTPSSETDVIYSSSWGKIGEGVKNSTASPSISFTGGAVGAIYTANIWINPDVLGTSWEGVLQMSLGSSLIINKSSFQIDFVFNSADHIMHNLFTTNQWQMLTFVSDGLTVKSYYNGTLDNTITVTGPSISFNGLFTGQYASYYTGAMDMFSIWQRALSASEIADLWNGGSGIQYPF